MTPQCERLTELAREENRLARADETPAPDVVETVKAAIEDATAPAEKVVAFPGAKPAAKTLEDIVNRRFGPASARMTPLQHVQVIDPVTGIHSMVLSLEGLSALREQLAGG